MDQSDLQYLAYCQDRVSRLHQYLTARGRFPHADQGAPLRALFAEGKKVVMGQCGRSFGKAISTETPILTPDGFTKFGLLQRGDEIFDENGRVCRVVEIYDQPWGVETYRVSFNDGTHFEACRDHLWLTHTKDVRKSLRRNRGRMPGRSPIKKPSIKTTLEIKNSLMYGKEFNHSIQLTAPIEMNYKELSVDPYVLGFWLGNGSTRGGQIDSAYADEVVSIFTSKGFSCSRYRPWHSFGVFNLIGKLKELEVAGNKHVPHEYLFCSIEQRLELLRGLMDADGTVGAGGNCTFDNTNKNLADAVYFLTCSLGMKPTRGERYGKLNGKEHKLCYRIYFTPLNFNPFRIKAKAVRVKLDSTRFLHRTIISVESVEPTSLRCIKVDSPSSLFLIGENLVPTHNTEDILYIVWRYALTHPKTETYIICPEIKQAKKIYWMKRRLQDYGPREFVAEEFESKLQVVFDNGAYIILDGCENYNSLRGIKPNLVIYDEFQHHTKFFDEEVMQPNLSGGDVALVVMGTPPKRDCYYTEFRDNVLEKISQGHRDYLYMELPSSCNPTLSREWLAEKREDLFRKGKGNVWLREYEGKLVFDTESAIFPMFNRDMVKSDEWMLEQIRRDRKKLQYYAIFDPGTATCFAVLFAAINPYTSDVFLLDEIYETRREFTSSMRIWMRADSIKAKYCDDLTAWTNIYDEAAAWFQNEVRRELPEGDFLLNPTQKQRRNAVDGEEGRPGESVIMSCMLAGKFHVSSNCEKFVWEMEQYVRDEQGRYPVTNDHLVDCCMYLYLDSGYSLKSIPSPEDVERGSRPERRKETLRELVEYELGKRDYARGIEPDIYDCEDIGEIWN